MKLLNGAELASYIKERQARQVRSLHQGHHIQPKLAIIQTNPDPASASYLRLKQAYGADIHVAVDVHTIPQGQAIELIEKLNHDPTVHGIIVQLPLINPQATDQIINTIAPHKDVDGLGANAALQPATPLAITWLLAGYNINLSDKQIVIVGQGRLVGKPLAEIWRHSGLTVQTADITTQDLAPMIRQADVIVTATGQPGLITADMLKIGAVVVDAGVATDKNKLVGDVADNARQRDDLTITPPKGGVGPLTVCALFENVITAASNIDVPQKGV